jgi:Na+/phosphate symporter
MTEITGINVIQSWFFALVFYIGVIALVATVIDLKVFFVVCFFGLGVLMFAMGITFGLLSPLIILQSFGQNIFSTSVNSVEFTTANLNTNSVLLK